VISLSSQLAYTYSANRKAPCPFEHLLYTSLDGKTLTRLESLGDAGYKRWAGVEWWTKSYEKLWDPPDGHTTVDRGTIVYLTADSDVELMELKEGETYIIGGIVDHNRYKVGETSHVRLARADRARDRTCVLTKRSRPMSVMLAFQ
jgi:tRNA (guanine9-N1)-methyltransferase